MKYLLALVALAGCSSQPVPAPRPSVVVPPELRSCPSGVAQAPAPKPPRTLESIAHGFNEAKAAGDATMAALKECSSRLDRLNQLLDRKTVQ